MKPTVKQESEEPMVSLEIDDELLNCIHQPAVLTESISYEDSKLSMRQRMVVNYDSIDMEGKYGFMQDFTQNEIHGYFRQMNKYASVSMNEIIDTLEYTEHFHASRIRGKLLGLLKEQCGKKVDEGVMVYHFALEPKSRELALRSSGTRNARVYFLIGRFGIIHVLFFDPYHEINP